MGPQGAAGKSGVVKTLSFDAGWTGTNLPGNSGNTVITPGNCKTAPHTAAASEVAFVTLSGTASSAGQNDVLYIFATKSVNGSPNFTVWNQNDSAESLSDGTAHASIHGVYPLEAGKSYVFAAGFATNGPLQVQPAYCHGAVLILKTA
jgi:hypothetical protein